MPERPRKNKTDLQLDYINDNKHTIKTITSGLS